MPELPEVETVLRGLEPVCKGQVIDLCALRCEKLRFPFSTDFVDIVQGSRIEDIRRRGKYMVLLLSKGRVLVWHLGMSGRVKISGRGEAVLEEKHDHVLLELGNGSRIIYNDPRRFGFMVLSPDAQWQEMDFFAKMGPEPLGNHFDGGILKAALNGKATDIKTALLDQRVVAGIGNIYACEALYQAGISPKRKAGSLSRQRCDRLAEAIRDVLMRALASGGSTLKDYRHTDGSLGYFQHNFKVYDREGQACPREGCGCVDRGGIKRITQGGRSTFYCPQTQK